jgi:hypothetical protein
MVSLAVSVALGGCARSVEEAGPPATATPVTFTQWAGAVEASSQFGYPDWSVTRATGAPEIDVCADDSRAWASAHGNGLEWLLLTYAKPVRATEVRVYQTFGRGAVSRVLLVDVTGATHVVWEGEDASAPCPGVLSVPLPVTAYDVTAVRVELDESRTGFWNQIDAVALVGVR